MCRVGPASIGVCFVLRAVTVVPPSVTIRPSTVAGAAGSKARSGPKNAGFGSWRAWARLSQQGSFVTVLAPELPESDDLESTGLRGVLRHAGHSQPADRARCTGRARDRATRARRRAARRALPSGAHLRRRWHGRDVRRGATRSSIRRSPSSSCVGRWRANRRSWSAS